MGAQIKLGIERLCKDQIELIRGAKVGLICNQSSVDHSFQHAADLLASIKDINLTTLFGPQHGIRGDVQDNMVETPHTVDSDTGLPVYSLYSETREPTEEMLKDLDIIIFDMQDVGCRIYTFIYTLANCMRAAKKFGKRVLVCDRPNPINGIDVAGTVLKEGFESFVGQFPLPTRHGMTVGELARMFHDYWGIECDLEIVAMEGWKRGLWFDQTDAPWVMPSPNMPTLDSATVFPGTVHVEGTQMSEGRGTTRPFELIGAPYINPREYAQKLNDLDLSGVTFRPTSFLPTFQKHAGRLCGGVQIHVINRQQFEPVSVGVAVVKLAYQTYPEQFRWKNPPYEYEFEKNPFDVIAGTETLRDSIEKGENIDDIISSWRAEIDSFLRIRSKYLLY